MQSVLLFVLLAQGFSNRDLREQLAPLLGLDPGLATLSPHAANDAAPLKRRFDAFSSAIKAWCDGAKIAA